MENDHLDKIPKKIPGVVSRTLEDKTPQQIETVLVIPHKGEIKVINELGARIWDLIDGEISIHDIVNVICLEYEVDVAVAENDTLEFLTELAKRDIITIN